MIERPTPAERFFRYVDLNGPRGCWLWTGALIPQGYAQFTDGERKTTGHRFAYELLVGLIPEGLQLDHLCRVRHCVNPAHLEPVTPAENTRRGEPAQRTHCPVGHAYDANNTYVNARGWRQCRACHRNGERVRKIKRQLASVRQSELS